MFEEFVRRQAIQQSLELGKQQFKQTMENIHHMTFLVLKSLLSSHACTYIHFKLAVKMFLSHTI